MFPYGKDFNEFNENNNNDVNINNNNIPAYFVYNNILQFPKNYYGYHLRTEVFYPLFNELYVNVENNEINEESQENLNEFNDIYMYNNNNINGFYEESDSIDEDNEISKVRTTKPKTSSLENEDNIKENINKINNKKSEYILLNEEKEKENNDVIDMCSEDRKKYHQKETLSIFNSNNKTKKITSPSTIFLKHKLKRKSIIFNNSLGKRLKMRKKDTRTIEGKNKGIIRNGFRNEEKNNIKIKQKNDNLKLKSNIISNSSRISCKGIKEVGVQKNLLLSNESYGVKNS